MRLDVIRILVIVTNRAQAVLKAEACAEMDVLGEYPSETAGELRVNHVDSRRFGNRVLDGVTEFVGSNGEAGLDERRDASSRIGVQATPAESALPGTAVSLAPCATRSPTLLP